MNYGTIPICISPILCTSLSLCPFSPPTTPTFPLSPLSLLPFSPPLPQSFPSARSAKMSSSSGFASGGSDSEFAPSSNSNSESPSISIASMVQALTTPVATVVQGWVVLSDLRILQWLSYLETHLTERFVRLLN